MLYYDLHSHRPARQTEDIAIISIDLHGQQALENIMSDNNAGYFSVGIHPWNPDKSLMPEVKRLAALPYVVAIGETGLDKATAKKQGDFSLQQEIFAEHIFLSEETKKPLIIHCVKAWDELLCIHTSLKPSMPWIIHGFRGNAILATQLLDAGLYLSFGMHHNTEALKKAWDKGRLFAETDDADVDICEVCTSIAGKLNIPINELLSEISSLFLYFPQLALSLINRR